MANPPTSASSGDRAGVTAYDHLASYLRACKRKGYPPSTLRHKEKENRLFLEYLAGTGHSMMVEDVTVEHVQAYFDDLLDRGRAITTVRTRRANLRAWWAWMVSKLIAETNIVSETENPRLPKIRKPSLAEADFKKVLEACDADTLTDSRRLAMLLLAATTGLRRGELAALDLEDLDWDRGRISIRAGKGQRSRAIPFMLEVQEAVRRYLAHRTDADPALWVTEKGLRFKYHGVGKDMERLYKRAGVAVVDCPAYLPSLLRHVGRPAEDAAVVHQQDRGLA